jgi:hypothetical protein
MQETLATSTFTNNTAKTSTSPYINSNNNKSGTFNGTASNSSSIRTSAITSLKAPRVSSNAISEPSSSTVRHPINRNPPALVEPTFALDGDDFAEDFAVLEEIERVESSLKVLSQVRL